jgi:hypothetical protein
VKKIKNDETAYHAWGNKKNKILIREPEGKRLLGRHSINGKEVLNAF